MDGCLSDEAQHAGRAHLDECPVCARHDVLIRRSLMALQSLPMIEPSAGFRDRLYERLAREELHYSPVPSRHVRWGMAATIVAASVALLFAASSRSRQTEASRQAAVMAQSPASLAAQRPVSGFARRDVAASTGVVSAGVTSTVAAIHAATSASAASGPAATRSRARFEALPQQGAARSGPLLPQGSAVRLQTVSYIGQ